MSGNGTPPPGAPGRGLENVQPAPNPQRAGEAGRALTHGATSEQRLAPLRQEHAVELRRDYPNLDERRLAILADRLARLDSARAWLDTRPGVVRNEAGDVFPIVDRLEKWAGVAERRLTEVEGEARAARPAGEVLADHLAAEYGGER